MEVNSDTTVNMKTQNDFLAQVDLVKAALRQFVKVVNDPDFANADATKTGAMENLMKHIVRLFIFLPFVSC